MKLIDFAARTIAPQDIKAAGFDGVVAYVSESRPGAGFGAKPITREYADALRGEGLHIVSNFQYGKRGGTAPPDFTRGFEGGMRDARTALRLHEAAGGPDAAPIIFSIDEDIDLATWNGIAVDWFRGIDAILGVERTGIYGHSRACAWAIEDGVIGSSTTPGRRWVWQTKAWSFGQLEPAAVLFQNVIDTASNPGPLVAGTRVDVSEVLAEDFGQWDLDRSPRAGLAAPHFDDPGSPIAHSPITQGATGRHVAMIQERLNTVANAGLLVDGEYASLTSRAIAAFQHSRGLRADGDAGSRTWAELFADRGPIQLAAGSETTRRSSRPESTPVSGDPVWLEDVLRPALGDRLRTLPGWKQSGVGGTMGRIWGTIWHHTGDARASAQSIRDGRPDLMGPLAQLHIAPDGIVTIVAVGPCNHAGLGSWKGIGIDNANAVTIGVECAWPFDTSITEKTETREPWPDAQIISMRDVGAAITTYLGVGADHNISHEEWARFGPAGWRQYKWDPGNLDMDWFRGEIAKDMRGESAIQAPLPPQTPDYVKTIWDQLRVEWPQLGGQTLVNAVAEIRDTVCGTDDSGKQ
jgi:peptidoglycan hydrolase-like protein with peptidoglycan-binding domain